jgi:cell division protein FtsB
MRAILVNPLFIALLTLVGTVCWVVCFWWMRCISARQDTLLKELHAQTRRIERISRTEHELMKEVHPSVEDIKETVEEVAASVKGGR